jgi:hypothetical protein
VATGKRDIYCDLNASAFVQSQKSSQGARVAGFFHQDKITLSLHALELDPTRAPNSGPYSELDPTGWSAAVKIFNSSGTVLASQTSWTVSGTALVGSLDLNTANMATEFASSAVTSVQTAIFEVELTDGTGAKFTFQDTVTIKREYIVVGSPSALPLPSYYTKDEINALFVRFSGNPDGATITLTNGAKEVVLGAGTDGDAQANAV